MVSVWCVYVGIWFFKQRTAFEMRISYLSSDVCSADLHLPPGYIRRCIHLRGRRRAATLCPGLHRIGKRCFSQGDYPMTHAAQINVPATYMRGGTSKGYRKHDVTGKSTYVRLELGGSSTMITKNIQHSMSKKEVS